MLRILTNKFYCTMLIQPKVCLTAKQRTLIHIKNSLTGLFSSHQNVILLAKTLRIFPSYFTQHRLNQMLNSEYIDDYVDYVMKNPRTPPKAIQDQELKQTLTKLKMRNPELQRILQIYINFLQRTEDLIDSELIMEIFDVQNPENWFRHKDTGQRKFIYHHGPTNSGKTYSAINQLKNLRQDQNGVYMAPLRLLAWQTQQKLGKCNLITGQQKDYQNSNITSCTIEAYKPQHFYDVAIIDQIQMLGDSSRGWSWTSALLGLRASKIHLCGDERGIHLVSKLVEIGGGKLEEKKYVRLSKLHLINRLFKFDDIKPGDCIIDFSANQLYKLRQKINMIKGTKDSPSKTAIIYGKMPPVCRKTQANKFNNGQLPYLVASDAIGMGLNLKIRRIIFINLQKKSNDGNMRLLEDHQIRQIAGRAGRGLGHGYVQCGDVYIRDRVKFALRNVNVTIQENISLQDQIPESQQQLYTNNNKQDDKFEKPEQTEPILQITSSEPQTNNYNHHLSRYLKQDQMKLKKAGIFFPSVIIQRMKIKMERMFNRQLKISETIKLIIQLSKQNQDLYFIQQNPDLLEFSDQLEKFNLPFQIHYLFAQLPIPNSSSKFKQILVNYARQFKQKGEVKLPDDLLSDYQNNFSNCTSLDQINTLQNYFVAAEAYSWLWNHLELYFPYNNLSIKIKQAICQKMNQILKQPFSPASTNKQIKRNKRNSQKNTSNTNQKITIRSHIEATINK